MKKHKNCGSKNYQIKNFSSSTIKQNQMVNAILNDFLKKSFSINAKKKSDRVREGMNIINMRFRSFI